MVESAMVKNDLSHEMIRAGSWLTAKLAHDGMQVSGSFWLYSPEANSWRLVIASPAVSEQGPKAVYGMIQDALSDEGAEAHGLQLDDVSVVTHNDPTYRLLRRAVHVGPVPSGFRYSQNVINGHYIEDAWIYVLV